MVNLKNVFKKVIVRLTNIIIAVKCHKATKKLYSESEVAFKRTLKYE